MMHKCINSVRFSLQITWQRRLFMLQTVCYSASMAHFNTNTASRIIVVENKTLFTNLPSHLHSAL